MSLTLHFHPLASYCWKALIALYENNTPFQPVVVDFGNPASAARFRALWPLAKMPVLVDSARGETVAEATVVVEYLDAFHQGPVRFVPADPALAWKVRFWDRFSDNYLQEPMQKIVLDTLRPQGSGDAFGVAQARKAIVQAYDYLESRLGEPNWIACGAFSLGDCSAAPALFYANVVEPLTTRHPQARAYLGRLMARPSFSRVLEEAEPFFGSFPLNPKPSRKLQG